MRVTVKYKNGLKECFEDVKCIEEVPNFGYPAVKIKYDGAHCLIEKEYIDKIKIKVGEQDA